MTPKSTINTVTMVVEAYCQGEAIAIAKKANENLFAIGDCPYIYTESLDWEEWLVILADNRDEARQAREKYFAKFDD